jgi:hypothetical protein
MLQSPRLEGFKSACSLLFACPISDLEWAPLSLYLYIS